MSLSEVVMKDKIEFIKGILDLIEKNYVFKDDRFYDWIKNERKSLYKLEKINKAKDLYETISNIILRLNDPHTNFRNIEFQSIPKLILCEKNNKFYLKESIIKNFNVPLNSTLEKINETNVEDIVNILKGKYKFNSLNVNRCHILEDLMKNQIKEGDNVTFSYKGEYFKEKIIAIDNVVDDISYLKKKAMKLSSCHKLEFDDFIYVKLISFRLPGIKKDLIKILNETKAEYLIIDIRNNQGGIIDLAKEVAGLFLNDNTIIGYTEDKTRMIEPLIIKGNGEKSYTNKFKKIIIVVNRNTASCAENIFLKALIRNSNIITMGEATMGLQHQASEFKLIDNSILQITTKKYLDLNKNLCEDKGIVPDINLNEKNYNKMLNNYEFNKSINIIRDIDLGVHYEAVN